MKPFLISIAVLGGVGIVTAFVANIVHPNEAESVRPHRTERVANTNIGMGFEYKIGQNGYLLSPLRDVDDVVRGYLLTRLSDARIAAGNTPTSTPPTIEMYSFRNIENQPVREWIASHSEESLSSSMRDIPRSERVGEEDALRYSAGATRTDVTVVPHAGIIYVITANYTRPDSELGTDYEDLIRSITFTRNT